MEFNDVTGRNRFCKICHQSKENNKKAKDVLERDWKDRIHDGQFIVYTYAEQNGEKALGANAVHPSNQHKG